MDVNLGLAFSTFAAIFNTDAESVKRAWRYLREAGLAPEGKRGRGGRPAEATPEAAFNLLVGMLATDARERTGDSAIGYVMLLAKGSRCGLTGALDFRSAGARILADPKIAARVGAITVTRNEARAAIIYRHDGQTTTQEFSMPNYKAGHVRVDAVFDGDFVRDLAVVFADAEDSDWTPEA